MIKTTDKYNCRWPLLFARIGYTRWAVTLGQTTYYSCSKVEVDEEPGWREHEDCHKDQWKREGRIRFAVKYLWRAFYYGYYLNPYEIQARIAGEWRKQWKWPTTIHETSTPTPTSTTSVR